MFVQLAPMPVSFSLSVVASRLDHSSGSGWRGPPADVKSSFECIE